MFLNHIKHAKKTGKLLMQGEPLLKSEYFSRAELKQISKLIKEIDISYTKISSIEGLPKLPNLRIFSANNTRLDSFKGFLSLKSNCAIKIEIKNTPLSSRMNFRLALLVLFGDIIVSINGKAISDKIRLQANKYNPCCAELINQGWEIVYPPPKEEELKEICSQYSVNYVEKVYEEEEDDSISKLSSFSLDNESISTKVTVNTIKFKTPSPKSKRSPPPIQNTPKDDEDINLSPLKTRAPNLSKFIDEKLAADLSDLFKKYGIEVSSKDYNEIAYEVASLCDDIMKYEESRQSSVNSSPKN